MTMSCPEVVYQAYYPYLYQRAAGAAGGSSRPAPFPPFSHQYDRVNAHAQRGLDASVLPSDGYLAHHSSSGSVSSGGGGVGSPGSPPRRKDSSRHGDPGCAGDDDDEEDVRSRAQYLSANCVVFTSYAGDVEAVVDQHFARALSDFAADKATSSSNRDKLERSPMSARNFPPSFWISDYQAPPTASTSHPSFHEAPYHAGGATGDPWHSHYQQYHHHRAVHEYHHHHSIAAAAQYGGLLLPPPPPARLSAPPTHQYAKAEQWAAHAHSRLHHEAGAHALDAGYAAYPGLEPQVQESSKDLYWF